MKYSCINIQGNLITEEILQKIEEGSADGQANSFFGLDPSSNLRNEIEYAWSRIRLDWKHFSEKSQNLPAGDPYGTTITRRWMENFLNSLGFSLTRQKTSLPGDNQQTYFISHTVQNLDDLPVHIVGFTDPARPEKNTIDMRSSGGTSRLSPHSTMQEYLNVTEHLYGIAANGWNLRLMRDSGRLVKLTYLEFDLRRMLDEDKYSEFTLLYRLMHASRFPRCKEETEQSLLEKYYQQSIETGNRIRDGLSLAVQDSLVSLGNGFLQSVENNELRVKIRSRELSTQDFYRQIRRLVYRLLFLMVMEERDLVYDPDDRVEDTMKKKAIYIGHYSIARLRNLSEKRYLYEDRFTNLWQGLMHTFSLFEAVGPGKKLGISPLSGDLFSNEALRDIGTCMISNKLLLDCIRKLNEFTDADHNLVQINYRALDVEELGSVYEGLLELHPIIENIDSEHPAAINFLFHEGTDRKTTGSYYTRPELVNELIKSALIPVIEERLAGSTPFKSLPQGGDYRRHGEEALLSLKVCDPAAGSGHFLLAAARTIAWYLARVRSGEENPPPSEYRSCLREVIQHCIYGVDLNPDAVELCKLALWLESHNSGKPLSFLDHKIRCGNSLVGVTDLKALTEPLPDEAFNPVTGDDPAVCRELKRQNKAYRNSRQTSLFSAAVQQITLDKNNLNEDYAAIGRIRQDTIEAIDEIRKKYGKARTSLFHEEAACNIWTSAFFHTYIAIDDPTNPGSEKLSQFFLAPTQWGKLVGKVTALASQYHFFHWPLEFPDVFKQGGFDVMLGNPPWERIKLQQEEFFATRDVKVAKASNAAERNRMIRDLKETNPDLHKEYLEALHGADASGKFMRESGRYVLTAVGDINTYSIFSELFLQTIQPKGRTGFIVPTGIATDDSNKAFFGYLVENKRLVSLFDFENREAIFPGVHRSYKFSLLTISGSSDEKRKSNFGFFLTRVEHLQDKLRIFSLTSEDFIRLNPNTKTCPVFRTSVDAELTTKIYRNVPILINEQTGDNPWGIKFKAMFHMANDSHLFRTRQQMELEGFTLWGNKMRRGSEIYLPLYEAKMIWHYDHRFGTYAGVGNRTSTQTPTPTIEKYQDPEHLIIPWYWVDTNLVNDCLSANTIIGFRRITNNTNERTFVGTLIPKNGFGDNTFLLLSDQSIIMQTCLTGLLSSLAFDYICRQKLAGMNMNFFYVNQFPVLMPNLFSNFIMMEIVPRISELSYASWDIKSFIDEVWDESDEHVKYAILRQWKGNRESTGGHEWTPPYWAEQPADPNEPGYTGCPLPPFKWDEERRSVIKAELDAIYAKLYGLTTEELQYILDPQDVYGPDFPGETFRVQKEKEIRLYGEYRTKRLVMEAWKKID
ncbi:MAG: hypothetical protein WCR01_10555 [Bacteroidota bacterium]